MHEPRLREGLEQLADQDPSRLRTLAHDARREADAAGQVAMSAFSTIARHEPFEHFIERITEAQSKPTRASLSFPATARRVTFGWSR